MLTFLLQASNCLVVVVGDCSVCFATIIGFRDDQVVQERFETSIFSYPMTDPENARDSACAKLAEILPTLTAFWSEAKEALARTKFSKVLIAGLTSESIACTVEKCLNCTVERPKDDWEDVSRVAMTLFCSAPSAQSKFQALELKRDELYMTSSDE